MWYVLCVFLDRQPNSSQKLGGVLSVCLCFRLFSSQRTRICMQILWSCWFCCVNTPTNRQQLVPFFAYNICEHLRVLCERCFRWVIAGFCCLHLDACCSSLPVLVWLSRGLFWCQQWCRWRPCYIVGRWAACCSEVKSVAQKHQPAF